MDEHTFQTKITELMNKIKQLPEDERMRLERLVEEARKGRQRIQASVAELQESLDHLRLSIKYLVFDLEATRRENAYLRQLVEQANRDDSRQRGRDADDFADGESSGD
ncbi:MAG: transcriptional regulator [Planctomycetota bacterium]|jgi:septal ring factor EnvC (AmiA/AmiB activator)